MLHVGDVLEGGKKTRNVNEAFVELQEQSYCGREEFTLAENSFVTVGKGTRKSQKA